MTSVRRSIATSRGDRPTPTVGMGPVQPLHEGVVGAGAWVDADCDLVRKPGGIHHSSPRAVAPKAVVVRVPPGVDAHETATVWIIDRSPGYTLFHAKDQGAFDLTVMPDGSGLLKIEAWNSDEVRQTAGESQVSTAASCTGAAAPDQPAS
jgi:hypothetical protein